MASKQAGGAFGKVMAAYNAVREDERRAKEASAGAGGGFGLVVMALVTVLIIGPVLLVMGGR